MIVTSLLFFSDEVLSGLIGGSKTTLKSIVSLGSLGLGSLTSLRSLGLKVLGSVGSSFNFSLGVDLVHLLGEWVKSEHHSLVGEWVLLGLIVNSDGNSLGSELGLNLIGVDDSGQVGAGHEGSVHGVSRLLVGVSEVGSVKGVKTLEGILGEDDESSEVTTWSELDDVKSTNVASVNTWEVSSGTLDIHGVVTVDNKWSLSHDVLGVSVLSLSGSDGLGGSDLREIVIETNIVESRDERFGVWHLQVSENEWQLWDVLNEMTSGHNKRGNSGGSESRADSMSSLCDIDSSVPFSPDLEWSEHSSLSAHVTEGSLTRS